MLKRLSLFLVAALFTASVSAAPEVGDLAPDFTLPGSDGEQYTLRASRQTRGDRIFSESLHRRLNYRMQGAA